MIDPGDALFRLDGDVVVPTDLTRGGWSDDAQHGGPPSALAARAIEALPTAVPMEVVRLTVDLHRVVPLTPLRVETRILRDGRRIQLAEAAIVADGVEVATARGLKIRVTELDLPPSPNPPWRPPPGPAEGELVDWRSLGHDWGPHRRFHVDAIEIRSLDDSFLRPGPGRSWLRLLVPVVAGEEPSPLVRVAALADVANGNSQTLDPTRWSYVNPDLTLHLHRPLDGEWLGMASLAHQHPSGIGLADTELFDPRGPIGRVAQSQLIAPQPRPSG
ncbi:MAG TPA: thioesterase family protein [Actinobacteria bacterium]|nr:thioesterase family protein [Actinomycetota bacterium]